MRYGGGTIPGGLGEGGTTYGPRPAEGAARPCPVTDPGLAAVLASGATGRRNSTKSER